MGERDPALTIGRGIRCAAARRPGATAIVHRDRSLTYRELARRIARVSNMARERYGIRRGDRIALIAANCIEYVELVAGLADAGTIVATLNPLLTAAELQAILEDCDPGAIIAQPGHEAAAAVAEALSLPFLSLGGPYEALLAQASDQRAAMRIEETDTFALAYTSGTTGVPKGVLLPHRSRVLTFMAMASEYRCFGPDDNFLAMAPMCHGAGFAFACAPLFFGGTTSLFPADDPEAMLARLARQDISGVFMVPTQFARLFDLSDGALEVGRSHRLTSMISNAAALPQAMKERAIELFGPGLLNETYGSTEGGIITNIRPSELLERPGSVGLPFPGVEIELRGPDGLPVPSGQPGELFSRSPTGFAGYWRRPADTAEAVNDGWITVGDIAKADSDGFITIVDRKKDMVVTGGLNVYPREVENVIAALPGVREVAVVGEPDPEYGEKLRAFVVATRGATIDPTAIIAGCRDRLAGFKVPRIVSVIDQLPRNAGGKVLKTELRGRAAG